MQIPRDTSDGARRYHPMHQGRGTNKKQPTSTRILMKMRLDEVVASSLMRIDSKQVHGRASVYRRCAKNFATFLSLLVSSLQSEKSVFDVTPRTTPCFRAKHVYIKDTEYGVPVDGVVIGLEAFGERPLPATVHHTEALGNKTVVGQPRSFLAATLDHHITEFLYWKRDNTSAKTENGTPQVYTTTCTHLKR